MRRLKLIVWIALMVTQAAQAEDGIGFATPEDKKTFNSVLSEEFGKKLPAQAPQISSEQGSAAVKDPVSLESFSKKMNEREKLVQKLVKSLRSNDIEAYRSLVIAMSQSSYGTPEVFNHLRETAEPYPSFRWGNEKVDRAVPGNPGDGASLPLIQVYSGVVFGKGSHESTNKVFSVKILCGIKLKARSQSAAESENCFIREIGTD